MLDIKIQSKLFGEKPVKEKAVRQKTQWMQKTTGYGQIQWIKSETNRLLVVVHDKKKSTVHVCRQVRLVILIPT